MSDAISTEAISNSAIMRNSVREIGQASAPQSPLSLSLSRGERRNWQKEFSTLGKGSPSQIVKFYFRHRLFFEPKFEVDSLGYFLRRHARNSVEIVFHNLYHITARIGDRWVDFHWGAWREPTIVCTDTRLNLEKPKRAVVKVRNLMSHYGRRYGKDFSFGICMPLAAERIQFLHDELERMKEPVAFGMGGKDGETCLTLLTDLISKAPELGVSRTADHALLFQKMLRRNPLARLITVYSNSSYSHLQHPLRRMGKMALGPPSPAQLLKLWVREFAIPIPDQLYEQVSLTHDQILAARASRAALGKSVRSLM